MAPNNPVVKDFFKKYLATADKNELALKIGSVILAKTN